MVEGESFRRISREDLPTDLFTLEDPPAASFMSDSIEEEFGKTDTVGKIPWGHHF